MSLGTLFKDPKYTADQKQEAMLRAGLTAVMDDPDLPQWIKDASWSRTTPGERREYYYEHYVRDPARDFIIGNPRNLITGQRLNDYKPVGRLGTEGVADYVVPPNLRAAGGMAGGLLGEAFGGPVLGALGYELGGSVGGMAQGDEMSDAMMNAAPGAATWALSPLLLEKGANIIGAGYYDRAASNKTASKIGESSKKLFNRLWQDHPDLRVPRTPQELATLYDKSSGIAKERAWQSLGDWKHDFRNVYTKQPAFFNYGNLPAGGAYPKTIQVPVRYTDPVTHMAQRQMVPMTFPEAMDYQSAMYGKGYAITGGPRGSIWAEADRGNAAITRRTILAELQKIPRIGPNLASEYADYSHDYGMTQAMGDIFKGDTIRPDGLIDHNKIYLNATKPNSTSHLQSLVTPQETRQFISDIAPNRERIAYPQEGAHPHFGIGPVSVRLPRIFQSADVPLPLQPAWRRYAGPLTTAGVNQYIEQGTGTGE